MLRIPDLQSSLYLTSLQRIIEKELYLRNESTPAFRHGHFCECLLVMSNDYSEFILPFV